MRQPLHTNIEKWAIRHAGLFSRANTQTGYLLFDTRKDALDYLQDFPNIRGEPIKVRISIRPATP